MKAGRLLCCKSKVLRVSTGLLSRAAASQVLRSSGLRGCFVGARQEANSPPALLCPPQATLRADHLLLWDKKQTTNSSRTASGKCTGARDVVSRSNFFSARLRALGAGGKSPLQAPKNILRETHRNPGSYSPGHSFWICFCTSGLGRLTLPLNGMV